MEHALIKHEHKASLVERLGGVIDKLTPANTSSTPSVEEVFVWLKAVVEH